MVSFSIKPGDQTDEAESPNFVNKTELKSKYLPKPFFLSIRYFEKFLTEGVTNWFKTTRNKKAASLIL